MQQKTVLFLTLPLGTARKFLTSTECLGDTKLSNIHVLRPAFHHVCPGDFCPRDGLCKPQALV